MTDRLTAWLHLPELMRSRKQWCIALADKAPQALLDNKLTYISVHERERLHTFEDACSAAQQHGGDIGYILQSDDPFACIDMDVKDAENEPDASKHTSEEQFERYRSIMHVMDSYTETSRSGKGIHIWVQGSIGSGVRRDGVEVYSQERFMICTGNAINLNPIQDRNEYLAQMVSQMQSVADHHNLIDLEELEEVDTDARIFEKAMSASNAEKFNNLCNGEYEQYKYPSQSEADNALISMFTYYSPSNEQVKRLFRMTPLGQREKATKDDAYLNRTIKKIRSREAHDRQRVEAAATMARELVAQVQYEEQQLDQHQIQTVAEAIPAAIEGAHLPQVDNGLPWPPGLTGAIAGFIYNSSPRPVREVSIVAALGLMAGVCGKAYNIPQSGLNIYLILVARSAIGKEAMHSGISHLLSKLRESIPGVENFVEFNEFASGPALTKACAGNSSFLNIAGEWGQKLKRISREDGRDGPMQALRTVMTNLYQKSGATATVGGLSYSDKEKNVASVSGVAYSMMGETTPGTFYDSLTDSMMEDGFLSRFNIVEYNGQRPPTNPDPIIVPDPQLTQSLSVLIIQAMTLLTRYQHCEVGFSPEAAEIEQHFDRVCDEQINSTGDEGHRQMWNRAHLKVKRISALLAVADNPFHPLVSVEHINWAMDLVHRDIAVMGRRIAEGDIGQGDPARERKLISIMRGYMAKPVAKSYKIPSAMQENGIVPRKYLQIRVARVTAFSSHRLGSSSALDMALRSLVDSGYIMEVDTKGLQDAYNFHGKCYRILTLPDIPGMQGKK